MKGGESAEAAGAFSDRAPANIPTRPPFLRLKMPVSYDLEAIRDRAKVARMDPTEMLQSDLDREYLLAEVERLTKVDNICRDLLRQLTRKDE